MFVCKKTVSSFTRHAELGSASLKTLKQVQGDVKRRDCLGRSMIEMLGVLALVGILSIGGIMMYRRAVNNHHANTILDDVNRFAFVITEHGGYPEGEDIPKGDFKESGIYQLKGHQAYAGQYSIMASNVPKGICEILIDKGIIDYKVGVVTAGGSVKNEILYDTLHTDICTNDLNDVAFYFGDVSAVCNTDENEDTACTQNSDCCGGYFCAFEHPVSNADKGNGKCLTIDSFGSRTRTITVDGAPSTWIIGASKTMTSWSAQNFCTAQGLKTATRNDIGCPNGSSVYMCESAALQTLKENFTYAGPFWLEYFTYYLPYKAHLVYIVYSYNQSWRVDNVMQEADRYALCH